MLSVLHAPHNPQFVDQVKTTMCGLPKKPHSVDSECMADSPYRDIGERLEKLRVTYSDDTQREWAQRLGFSVTQYNNWEKGVRRIPVDSAERLCDLYGLTLDFIYRGRRDGLSENIRKAV